MANSNLKKLSKANTVGIGFMISSVVLAGWSFWFDCNGFQNLDREFSWFSASGAVMVASTIVFERTMSGTSLAGGSNFSSLPSLSDKLSPAYEFFSKYGGRISMPLLIIGTLIWAYGALLV